MDDIGAGPLCPPLRPPPPPPAAAPRPTPYSLFLPSMWRVEKLDPCRNKAVKAVVV